MADDAMGDLSSKQPSPSVFVFHGDKANFASAVFTNLDEAEDVISRDGLTGMLTRYPLNETVFGYTVRADLFTPKGNESGDYIGRFTSASLDHFHYEKGQRA